MNATDDHLLVPRTGGPPLRLPPERETLLSITSKTEDSTRWYTIEAWKVRERFVLAIEYHTVWKSESNVASAWIVGSDQDLVPLIRDYDPTAHVIGYNPQKTTTRGGHPNADLIAAKQDKLLMSLRQQWGALASMAFADLDIAEDV